MANIVIPASLSLDEKVAQMRQDARFEIENDDDALAMSLMDIKQNVRSRKPPPTVPKVFLGNDCIFNCAYCDCREGNDCKHRYVCTPRGLAELSYRQAVREKRGIFITSAIIGTPDYTEELIISTLQILRGELGYKGYIHAKVMPGTDPELIRRAGQYANRLSVNIEVARSEGYAMIAHNKNKRNILSPMGQISGLIQQAREDISPWKPFFATSQTTQLMAGSTGEDDFTILNLSGALYRKYRLSRVYYTAFHFEREAKGYDLPKRVTPQWRMARLYQADRLMQLYGFSAEEIAPPVSPFLHEKLDPKASWALRNLHLFPVEVNRADYETLLRVPGIGLTYAKRIIEARQYCRITHDTLRSLGVAQKRSRHFITCGGKYTGDTCERADRLEEILTM